VSTFEKARSDVMMRQAMYQGLNQPSYMQPQMMQGEKSSLANAHPLEAWSDVGPVVSPCAL